jgi:hypothetical protein
MDKKGLEILRNLISTVEGAPYPNSVSEELYTIWFEHAQQMAQEALEYYDQVRPADLDTDPLIDL